MTKHLKNYSELSIHHTDNSKLPYYKESPLQIKYSVKINLEHSGMGF